MNRIIRQFVVSSALVLSALLFVGSAHAQNTGSGPRIFTDSSNKSATRPVDKSAAKPADKSATKPTSLSTSKSSFYTFDISLFPKDRQAIDEGASFPYLKGDYQVLAPGFHKKYNCIAHSLGIHDHWVNPKTGPATNPLAPMDQMYKAKGYQRVKGLDFSPAPGKDKVVVYAKVQNGKIVEVTHGALQEQAGTWTSKLGQLALIRHRTPGALNGPVYGQPVAVYVRASR